MYVKCVLYRLIKMYKYNINAYFYWQIMNKYTKGRVFGIFGEETVNVLQVNLALDGVLECKM